MGKTTAVHKLQNTLWERSTTTRIHRGNDLLSSSSPHAAVTVEATTSHTHTLFLSLSLSRCLCTHALYNYIQQKCSTTQNVCPKSYLYIYDFRVIYINVHSNRSDRSEPVLGSAGSLYLPSGGTCFPTKRYCRMHELDDSRTCSIHAPTLRSFVWLLGRGSTHGSSHNKYVAK